jgi:AcrR family transcriptional regulator
MSRWEIDTRSRLKDAALGLYAERGYRDTTVAMLAARAGTTERTFFRHFPDKREVLFSEDRQLLAVLLGGVADAPEGPALGLARAGVTALARVLSSRRDELGVRAAVIAGEPDLQERDATKRAAWTAALASSLRARGVPAREAGLAASAAAAVLALALEGWLAGPGRPGLLVRLDQGFQTLAEVVHADHRPQVPRSSPRRRAPLSRQEPAAGPGPVGDR